MLILILSIQLSSSSCDIHKHLDLLCSFLADGDRRRSKVKLPTPDPAGQAGVWRASRTNKRSGSPVIASHKSSNASRDQWHIGHSTCHPASLRPRATTKTRL
jgi:hypothetical protein